MVIPQFSVPNYFEKVNILNYFYRTSLAAAAGWLQTVWSPKHACEGNKSVIMIALILFLPLSATFTK